MDKERILAARKKLKEFQRNKKDQARKNENENENVNFQATSNSQKTSASNSPLTCQDVLQQYSEIAETKSSDRPNEPEIKSFCDSSNLFINDYVNNFTTEIQENSNFQHNLQDHESINGIKEIPSNHNFTLNLNSKENDFIVSNKQMHEKVDKNNQIQDSLTEQFKNSGTELNLSNNTSSLQKEHLLQMANAVANVLVDEKGFDELALNDLEQRNQFLTCYLEEQKKIANQLHIQVSQCNNKISELEAIISTKDAEFESKLIREVNPLKEQIQLDAQTIGILVGEKAELTATNTQSQITIKQKTDEVKDLFSKLKISLQRETDLQRELMNIKNNMEDFTKSYQQLQKNYEETIEKLNELKKNNEDYELEISELRQKLNYKNTELTSLQQEFQEKIALLSLSELRVQQLSNTSQEVNSLETQHHTTKVLEQQLSQMKEVLESVNGEKDEVSKKYQSYIQQLDERHSKLTAEFETAKKVIVDSEIREQSYIQRLSELEQQLQKEKAKPVKPLEDQSEKIDMLTKSIDNLVLEQENLQSLLNEKDNEIELLKKELKELESIREHNVEAFKLATALQSEQLGASRAISQNQQLKTQLDEMHDAFIALSNTKLDLTEKLQEERVIGKKLNAQLNDVELQVMDLKELIARKDALLKEFEKEKWQTAQIEDQIQHYQAQSHSATTLQQELQKALTTVEILKKENQSLQSRLQTVENNNSEKKEISEETTEKSIDSGNETDILILEDESKNISCAEIATKTHDLSLKAQHSTTINTSIQNIPEPVKKLENRFKETMEKVAELTDEKQRLEHLVLQLQGETETIGEYVTLYQKQRLILQEKAKEKENTFRQLLDQRNQQQEQLHKLKVLVADLLKSKNPNLNISTATIAEENMPISDQLVENESNNIEVVDGHVNKSDETIHGTDKTTSQILDLLTEIKDCNTCFLEPNFHPCPWCSGKLITV